MKNLILTTSKRKIGEKLGLSELSSNTKQFIFTHFNFILFTTIPGVFINTFFFNQDGKVSTVALFTAINYVGMSFVMHLASVISLKASSSLTIRIGIVFYNIFFITLLLLQNNAAKYMVLLAIINAIANGFYWQGYNELTKILTSDGNYDKTVSIMGVASSIVNLTVPLISGYIIMFSPNKTIGYTVVFIISFLFSLYTTWLAMRLDKLTITANSNIKGMYKFVFTNKIAFIACLAEFMRGIRNAAFPLFLSIIFYREVLDEGILGINTTVCGLVAIISYIAASKLLKPKNRIRYIFVASFVSTLVFCLLFFSMSPWVLFALGIINGLVAAFIDNPAVGIFYTLFRKMDNDVNFTQLMSGREVFFGVGRAAGLILLIFLSNTKTDLALFALISNVTLFAMLGFYAYCYKNYRNNQSKELIHN